MKERKLYKTLIGSCVLMLCMAVVMIFTVFQADASDESKTIKYESLSMSSYWSTTEKTAPTEEGYVFGGWYTKSGDTYTALKAADVTTSSDGKANVSDTYAKFVPKEVLDIKAQVSDTLFDDVTTNDDKAAIRFVTSLDNSMSYQKVGFNIKKGSTGIAEDAATTGYVYRTLYAVGATDKSGKEEEYKPKDLFHSESYYFKTWTITNITDGAYNTDVTVIPYWITLDGTRVEGTKAIKTVNLGRSWVYVDSNANTDGEEYGTRKHPYTDFSKALDTIFVADKGKVIAKAGCNLENPDTFKWNAHNVGVITVTAEDTDSYIGFNDVPDMEINDDVTFENMKLQFAKHVYAKGHHFKVADSVNLINDDTTLSGGGKTASVDSTNIEIYAGSWLVIYGSSEKAAGSVKGDTHITIGGNTQIKHASSGSQNMVFGGGYSNVGGSTYVTVGGTFNSGLDLDNHTALSTVYGGGRGTGEVAKDTNVIFKDSAMATYVYGGGAKGTKVIGTCHVTMNGGNVMSIWGGGATMDNTEAEQNANTSVVVNAGTVEQIFGGNGSGMTGNTYVEVSGGTITRRIYGGCYHDETTTTAYVKGTTNVIINDPDALQLDVYSSVLEKDNSLCTGSRYAGNQTEEIGTLIFNNGTYETYESKIGEHASFSVNVKDYDYLVKATTGGKVATEDMMLCVTPVEANPGTVTINDTVQYFKGVGSCEMPEITETTPKYTVDVVFNATDAQGQIEACEARIDGIYYDTFVNAVNSAKTRKNNPTVTVMKDCTVSTAIENVAGEEYTIVGDDGETKKIITVDSAVSELFQVRGKLTLKNLRFTSGQSIVRNYAGTLTLDNIEMHDIAGVGIYHTNGTTYAYNTTISNAVKFGVLVMAGTANIDNVNISGITGTDNRDAINVQGGRLNIYNKKAPYNGVTISDVAQRNGIHVTGGEVYADAVTITDIKTGHGIYVQKGSVKIDQLNVGAENGAIKKSALYMTGSNQAEAIISNFTASHIVDQVVYLEGNTSAEITNFNLTSSTDTGVRTKGTATVILEDGTITAENGRYGVYASDTSTVTATDVSIVRNVAMASGVDSLVYVNTGSTITLKEDDGTSMIQGNSELAGKGVVVKGTFNLEGGTITGHKLASTDNKGAGVHVQAGGVFNMSGGSVTGNTAVNGGGVALEGTVATDEVEAVSAMFYMNGGSIESNSATTDGAGVAVHTSGTFTMKGGNIQENTAPAGGGVSVNGTNATFTLENGNISQNTVTNDGGGVYLLTGGSFTMTGGSIQGNSAGANRGGGVCLYADDASFTLKNGTISGNTARAGGAVIVRKGSFTMDGGSITGNFANANTGSNGGAIYLSSGKNFTMNGGEITSNTATNLGGAIYTEGKSTITLGAGKLSGNTAKTGNNFGVHCVGTGASKGTLIIKAPFVLVDLYNNNFVLDDQRTTE